MQYSTGIKCVAAGLAIGASAIAAQVALASPGAGVTPVTFVTANLNEIVRVDHDRVKLQTKDPTTVRVQKLTFAPGSRTGWHHHPGAVVVAIETGSVTLVDSDCTAKVYGPGMPNGSVFVEGHDEAHEARSSAGATVYVTYISPDSTFRIEDDAQSGKCASAATR